MTTTVGIDLGGTNLRAALVDGGGRVVGESSVPTPDDGDRLIAAMVGAARELLRPDTAGIGVGAAGMVDADGVVRYAPNVPAFRSFPLRARLQEALEPPVVVDNDANVAAVGEVVHGAGRGLADVLVITLGTGIGGGIVVGGRPYRGANGFAAELGHFQVVADGPRCACGELGHWEAIASGTALGWLARERAGEGRAAAVLALAGEDPGSVTGEHVSRAALDGDPAALEIVAEYAERVAVGLAGLANILDPARIVIGGGLVQLGETLLAPVRDSFRRRIEAPDVRPEIPLVPAELGERAGVIGAAVVARPVGP